MFVLRRGFLASEPSESKETHYEFCGVCLSHMSSVLERSTPKPPQCAHLRGEGLIHRHTVDVADMLPVTVGQMKAWRAL
jgi:hypothetical protein